MEAPLNAVAIEVSQKSPKDPVMKETMRMVFLGSNFSTLLTQCAGAAQTNEPPKIQGKIEQLLSFCLFFCPRFLIICALFFFPPLITGVISIEVDPFFFTC